MHILILFFCVTIVPLGGVHELGHLKKELEVIYFINEGRSPFHNHAAASGPSACSRQVRGGCTPASPQRRAARALSELPTGIRRWIWTSEGLQNDRLVRRSYGAESKTQAAWGFDRLYVDQITFLRLCICCTFVINKGWRTVNTQNAFGVLRVLCFSTNATNGAISTSQ